MVAARRARHAGEMGAGPLVGLAVILAAFAVTAAAYPQLPATIARHWGIDGSPDGFSGRAGAFSTPLVMLGIGSILIWLPGIYPLRSKFEPFRAEYEWFVAVLEIFLFGINAWSLAWNLGWQASPNSVLPVGLALLLGYVGWVMGRVPRNWVIGVRTAWTLSDDRVWGETHRVARWLWYSAALLSGTGVLFPRYALWFVLGPVLAASLASVVYSYVVWVRLGRPEADGSRDASE